MANTLSENAKKSSIASTFANMSLRAKILSGFSVIVAILLLLSALSFVNLTRISSGVHSYSEAVHQASLAAKIETEFLRLNGHAREYAARGSQKDAEAVLSLVALYALFDQIGNHVSWLGLNTHGAVIVASLGGMALHIWTIKGYFDSIDRSLEEAAIVDGATTWQAFRYILLPLSVPILVVVFILAFIMTIMEYPMASVLLVDTDKLTLAVGAQQYLYEQNYLWGDFAAAAVLSGLPITVIFLYCQKWIVGGLTAGGVKG